MKEDILEKEKTAALLAENRGEAALFQRRENLQKHRKTSSATAKICLLQVLRCLPELQLKEEFRKKLHILSVTGIFRQSRNERASRSLLACFISAVIASNSVCLSLMV